jgi:hypothetical protein
MLALSSLFAGAGLSLAIAAVVSVQTVAIPTPTYEASLTARTIPGVTQVGRGVLQQQAQAMNAARMQRHELRRQWLLDKMHGAASSSSSSSSK